MEENPYVGARAYGEGEGVGLYGRTREIRDLLGRLIAQRIVLMYSPSGAGKTSLIESALVPALPTHRLSVLPRIRVGLDLSVSPSENRYIQSTLASLRTRRKALTLPTFSPAKHSLVQAVRTEVQHAAPSSGVVLIFDQFEEIVTLNSADMDAKHEFFAELGEALMHSKAWALFAIREEYLGLLDAFAHHIPTRFGNRFRLDLFSPAAAGEAIRGVARERGISFTDAAVKQLVDDLRKTKEVGPEGSAYEVAGPVVEPVHLQVVCRRLWDSLAVEELARGADGLPEIDVPQIERAGNVSETLRAYYSELVSTVAANTYCSERRIRHWIGTQLITGGRLRNQVMHDWRRTAGLDDRVLDALSNVYLVRKERRRGLMWYELAHDRLIDPIVEDNLAWFTSNPSKLQRLAEIWVQHERERQLLLRGEALDEFESELGKAPELTEVEREFLETSRRVDQYARAKRARRRQRLAAATYTLSLLGLAVVFWALWGRQHAVTRQDLLKSAISQQATGRSEERDELLKAVEAALVSSDTAQQRRASQELLQIVHADRQVYVRYFARKSEVEAVEAALKPLGYRLVRNQGTEGVATNQVLYGQYVPLEDVRTITTALIAAGIPIKRVSRFRTTRLLNSYQIQVLAAPQISDSVSLAIDSVRLLSEARPSIGVTIPLETPRDSMNTASGTGEQSR